MSNETNVNIDDNDEPIMTGEESFNRLAQFLECCEYEEINAEVIRDAWLQQRINTEQMRWLSDLCGIKPVLEYWSH